MQIQRKVRNTAMSRFTNTTTMMCMCGMRQASACVLSAVR